MTVKSAGTDQSHIRPGRGAGRPAGPDRRRALFHRPHPHALDRPQGLPEEHPRFPRIRRGLHHRGRSALGQALAGGGDLHPPDRALLDGPGAARPRGAGPGITASGAADLRAALAGAAEPDRAEPWSSFARSRATGSRWWALIAWTAPRSSTSSRISPRPTPFPTRGWAGTRPEGLTGAIPSLDDPAKHTIHIAGVEPCPARPRPMVRSKGAVMTNLRSEPRRRRSRRDRHISTSAAAAPLSLFPFRAPAGAAGRRLRPGRDRGRATASCRDNSSARSSTTDPRGARHGRGRYLEHLPLSRARRRPRAPLRHRRRPRGLHLGRRQDRRRKRPSGRIGIRRRR